MYLDFWAVSVLSYHDNITFLKKEVKKFTFQVT